MGKKIGIMTGGGDCPGLNPAIRGAVIRATQLGLEPVGIMDGWKGLINKTTMPLDPAVVSDLIGRGGTILGTSRTNPFKKDEEVESVHRNFAALGLDGLIVMGGEDTLGVASRLNNTGIPVVGIPKTMDNDLSGTDFTLGFDTSVTVAVAAAERLCDTGRSHRRIIVLEVMGRHTGWVALYTGIAAAADWILVPEDKVDIDAMCAHLVKAYSSKRFALVVTAEGIKIPDIEAGKEEVDAFGHIVLRKRDVGETIADMIEKKTGIETRDAVIGHIQRGGSPTLFDRMLGTRFGVKAAELAAEGKYGMMTSLAGNRIEAYSLEKAVAKLKSLPDEWLAFRGQMRIDR